MAGFKLLGGARGGRRKMTGGSPRRGNIRRAVARMKRRHRKTAMSRY